jgi:hypothetical protein
MLFRSAIPALLILVHIGAQCAPPTQSDAEQFLAEQISLVPRTLVEYCVAAAPEAGPSLEYALRELDVRVATASTPILDRLRAEGAFDAPVPARERAKLVEMKRRMLGEIAKLEPHAYCRQLLTKMRKLDAQGLVDAAEQAYSKYISAAKATARPAP